LQVTTKFFAFLREALNLDQETFELSEEITISEFLRLVSSKYRDKLGRFVFEDEGKLRQGFAVALNGVTVQGPLLDKTVLQDGDTVVILPPIAGGAYLKEGSFTPRCP